MPIGTQVPRKERTQFMKEWRDAMRRKVETAEEKSNFPYRFKCPESGKSFTLETRVVIIEIEEAGPHDEVPCEMSADEFSNHEKR